MTTIQVVAKIEIEEEHTKEVLKELKELHRLTHLYDKGCLQYDLNKDIENKTLFIFIEKWKNKDYLLKHEQSIHFKNCISKIEKKLKNVNINKIEYIDL